MIHEAFVICADKGLALAESLGVSPDLILGDFDSLDHRPTGDNVMTFPVEKDDTDLMLAVRTAIERGYKDYVIYGACGGRLDHMLGNIACLAMIADNGGSGRIVGDDEIISLHDCGTYRFAARNGFSLSLFAYSEMVKVLNVSGTKYPAVDFELTNAVTLGVSNEITEDHAVVSFSEGRLLVVQSRLER